METYSTLLQRSGELTIESARMCAEVEDLKSREQNPGVRGRITRVVRAIEKVEEENNAVLDKLEALERAAEELETSRKRVAEMARAGRTEAGTDCGGDTPTRTRSGGYADPWTGVVPRWQLTPGETRSRALSAVELVSGVDDGAKEHMTVSLEQAQGDELDRLSVWTTATSDPAYLRAFFKLAGDPQHGHREFDEKELAAFRNVQTIARAMSLTDAAGGYLLPFQLDPAVILTSSGATNPVRRLARKVTATSDIWHGVSSAGVTVSFDAEASEVSDDSPTLAQPTVTVRTMRGFVPISIEAFEDAQNVAQEVAALLADAADTLEAEKFITGVAASNEPVGVVTALTGTASEVDRAGTTLDAADFFAVQEALPTRFQANAAWIMHLTSINRGRSIIAGTGLTTPMVDDTGTTPRLLAKPVYEASAMDSTVTGTASDYLAVYGDFRAGYVIADRIGTTIELVPHLFGANGRPTGQRGWFMHRRVGGNVVNANALRTLDKNA